MEPLDLDDNPLLCGADQTAGIVAAELAGRFIRLFIRTDHGVIFRDDPFHPFILVEDPDLLAGSPIPRTSRPLAGNAPFCHIVQFDSWRDCLAARDFLAKASGRTQSDPAAPYLFLNDPVHQHLLRTGKTFFKKLPFERLRRLALDIETDCTPGYEFSNPERTGDRVLSVALVDENGYALVLGGPDLGERELLEELTAAISAHDPDVLEGHNLFRFDLEYLRVRAARCGVQLAWGRDGSEPRVHRSRFTVAERTIDYPRWDIYGRSIVDTYFLLQLHDVSSRELEGYGLKGAARHFGLAAPDRVYIEGRDIARTFREDLSAFLRYNLADARETLALGRLLAYPHFLQARIFPYAYQTGIIRGNATKINALFLREYLRRGQAVPRGGRSSDLAGGYTEVALTGVVSPVVHCDVASLYPSLMLTYRLKPASDRLDLFLPLLAELRSFRLAAKERAKGAGDPYLRDYYAALQQTFKILINSFYGYLGAALHNFADPAAAAEITRRGRETIHRMLDWLKDHEARPVEVDTDGIYFIPPATATTPAAEEQLVAHLAATLPAGITVELAGRYRAMFSYKAKNYALLTYDDRVIVKGSALRSRGIEKYLRQFMADLIRLLLTGAGDRAGQLHDDYREKLLAHRFPIDWLARTETLGEAPATYLDKVRLGKRNPSAAFELALASGHDYRAGDQISYYIAGQGRQVTAYEQCRPLSSHDPAHPDENIGYYLAKLTQLYRKFSPFYPAEKSLFD
jgi:DNA polymerase elongation subunit (family B)